MLKTKEKHHSSVCNLFLYCFWKMLRSVLTPMVKYGPKDSRSPCRQHIWENETLLRPPHQQPRTLMAQRLGLSGLRSKMASSSSTSTSSLLALPDSQPRNSWFWYHMLIIWLFKMRTCIFAMLKTVRLGGGLYDCSLKLKLVELSHWRSLISLKSN